MASAPLTYLLRSTWIKGWNCDHTEQASLMSYLRFWAVTCDYVDADGTECEMTSERGATSRLQARQWACAADHWTYRHGHMFCPDHKP